jgi:hypothetical protein
MSKNTIRVIASHIESYNGSVNIEEIENIAYSESINKANFKSLIIAKSIGVRILDKIIVRKEKLNPLLKKTEFGNHKNERIGIQVEIEYITSNFSQWKLDILNLLSSKNIQGQTLRLLSIFREMLTKKNRILKAQKTPEINNKAIVYGHFSFPGGGETFGDLEVKNEILIWLEEIDIDYDVAVAYENENKDILFSKIEPTDYGIFIFVCGPWNPARKKHRNLLINFNHCKKIGINLTTFEHGTNGFDFLISRDDMKTSRADIAFSHKINKTPTIGFLLVNRQIDYGIKQRHFYVESVIKEFVEYENILPIWLDTNVNFNSEKINNYQDFESIIRNVDLIISNRLHGLVIGIKNSVPVIAIDPIEGGGKVSMQAKAVNWDILISAEELDLNFLKKMVDYCLNNNLGAELLQSQTIAQKSIKNTKKIFIDAVLK